MNMDEFCGGMCLCNNNNKKHLERDVFLNYACFLESSVSTVFVEGLDSSSGEGNHHCLFEFRNIDALLLKIRVFADHAGRVELGCTSAV